MDISKIEEDLSKVLHQLIEEEAVIDDHIKEVVEDYRLSAKNLYRYLLLRTHDLRPYHDHLTDLGISSLRTVEAAVMNKLYTIVRNLRLMQGHDTPPLEVEHMNYKVSKKLLKKHANKLFNESDGRHFTQIMVTLPEEAASSKQVVEELVLSGMEIARINLSHGDTEQWEKMVKHVHEVRAKTGKGVKIYMDLPGPKIRTARIEILDRSGKLKNAINVVNGEHIILTKRDTLGKSSEFGSSNEQVGKAEIGVSLGSIIDDTSVGDNVLFDDGMIRAKVIRKNEEEIELVVTHKYKKKLSSAKGINLPNTKLNLPALTDDDKRNLPFISQYADMLGYSFVRSASDVEVLYSELEKLNAQHIGVIFKIENEDAFKNLPEILFEGMKRDKIGVMIARGDLAVEIGFDRISEVQNQILWLCEAAHIPVIWATQVLENLAKTGIPTRAEISDAALGAQAECVMLNKGPFINDAIRVLKDILIRMESHSFKKKNELRALNVAKDYFHFDQA